MKLNLFPVTAPPVLAIQIRTPKVCARSYSSKTKILISSMNIGGPYFPKMYFIYIYVACIDKFGKIKI